MTKPLTPDEVNWILNPDNQDDYIANARSNAPDNFAAVVMCSDGQYKTIILTLSELRRLAEGDGTVLAKVKAVISGA